MPTVVNRQHVPGTYSGYNWHMERRKQLARDGRPFGKRHKVCLPCQKANTIQMDSYRKRVYLNGGNLNRHAAGVRRRLQALAVMGYNFKELGKRYGRDGTVLANLANQKDKQTVYAQTAEKIIAIYDELAMIPPGDDWLHRRTATQARNRGYLPPLAWEDETIDNPYALPVGLTREQAHLWFWRAASTIERIEWVLTDGLSITRKKYWLY